MEKEHKMNLTHWIFINITIITVTACIIWYNTNEWWHKVPYYNYIQVEKK